MSPNPEITTCSLKSHVCCSPRALCREPSKAWSPWSLSLLHCPALEPWMEESSHFQGDIPKDLLCFWLTESEGNITNLCNHPTTHPNSVILATLVGKIRLLTPRLPDTGWSLLAKSLLFLFLTRSRLWYPGLVTKERFLSSPLPFSLNPQFKMKCQCSWGTKSFVDVGSCSVRLSLLSLGSSSCAAAGHGVLLLWGSLGKLSLEDFALKSVQCHWDGLFP